jgi:hypothetical protein
MNTARRSRKALLLVAAAMFTLAACESADAWPRYRNAKGGYSISYPPSWRVDTSHDYQALGPGKDIRGTAFVVSPSTASGTNLSPDSYLAVEELPDTQPCSADKFLDDAQGAPVRQTGKNGIVWSVAHGSDAGAGNFYEEMVYAVLGTQPCLAIRTFIHSTNIGNYDPGTVRAFDKKTLVAIFGKMRDSFQISPP